MNGAIDDSNEKCFGASQPAQISSCLSPVLNCIRHVGRGGLGQNFRPGNLTLIQAIPYTHNKFWNMTTLLAYLYDHHIKRSKSLVGAVENN